MNQQLLVAAGVFNSLKSEASGKISERENELTILKNELNEFLNLYPNE